MNEILDFWPIILLIATIGLVIYLRPKIKGFIGELTIRFILLFLNKKEYKVLNNVRVFHNGIMAQIDHVVVSRFGVFVIETKNYYGWIFGSENAYQWKQVIFNNTYEFYNPIRQNLGHIKALQANLKQYPALDYFPIVVFTRGSKLKVNSSFPVIKYYYLLKTIKSVTEINISEEIRDEIYNSLLKINGNKPLITPKKATDEDYINNNKNICPYCGNTLISKSGKYGKFLGCADYPRCTYTKKIGQNQL